MCVVYIVNIVTPFLCVHCVYCTCVFVHVCVLASCVHVCICVGVFMYMSMCVHSGFRDFTMHKDQTCDNINVIINNNVTTSYS